MITLKDNQSHGIASRRIEGDTAFKRDLAASPFRE
jgi:hypothetical protein